MNRTQQSANQKKNVRYILNIFIYLTLLASVGFVIFLLVTHFTDMLLLLLLGFCIVVAIIIFWRVLFWITGAVAVIVIICVGIALLGYIGKILQ
ncbi:hypothetical protein [Fictibacillus enclensis]|uniref:hypothetical protein n=1 Tax=Fictibacillus enclensis TaxID=1017270 RepID=UPI0024C03948|nr:hypothetical protein [Fictibacillus enclensis]WHY71250.1 hypothetical protein QNH15_19890 [Fictibacillus enclensis]